MSKKTYSGKAVVSSSLAVCFIVSAILFAGCDRLKKYTTSSDSTVSETESDIPGTDKSTTFVTESETTFTTEQVTQGFYTEETEQISTDIVPNLDISETAQSLILNFDLRYFLCSLNDTDLTTVCAIYNSAIKFSDTCTLPGHINDKKLSDLVTVMRAECPELFHVDFDSITKTDSGDITELSIKYKVTEDEYKTMMSDAESVIASLVSSAMPMNTDTEKEKFVFDFFALECTYDLYSKNADTAYGALVDTSTSSIGISLAVKWVMEELGIRCICVTADCIKSDIPHAWNIIEIDGEFFTLDITPSIKHKSNEVSADDVIYCAFNMSDYWTDNNYFIHDSFTDIAPIPSCDTNDKSLFAKLGYFIRRGDDPSDALLLQIKDTDINSKGKACLQFESSNDFDSFVRDIDGYLNKNNISCTSLRYVVFEYNVCVIYINE